MTNLNSISVKANIPIFPVGIKNYFFSSLYAHRILIRPLS